MKKTTKNTATETIEAKPKRKYTKRAACWGEKKKSPAVAKAEKKMVKKLTAKKPEKKVVRKESVMKVDKRSLKKEKRLLKEARDAERAALKAVEKSCKLHAKELSKMEDGEEKNKKIAKLIKMGYVFDVSDPNKLVVSVDINAVVVPKQRKLKNGAKAVEKKAVAVVEPTAEKKAEGQPNEIAGQPNEKPAELVVDEQPNEVPEQPSNPEHEELEPPPAEIPIGDTFTDEQPINGPTDEELAAIEAEENGEEPEPNEADELAAYRKEFFAQQESEENE